MATTDETQSKAERQKPKAKRQRSPRQAQVSLKMIIMAVGGLVVLGGLGGGGYYFFFAGHGKAEAAAAAVPQTKPVVFLDMPDVLVNLSSAGSDRTQYLKVKVTLELPDQAMSAQIQPMMPRLMDAFQTYLRELRPTDLDGSAGLYRLRRS